MAYDPQSDVSTVEYKTRCPRCAHNGRDRKMDNLAVYRDGHSYCFSCNLFIPSPSIERLRMASKVNNSSPDEDIKDSLLFPSDYCPILDALWSKAGLMWLKSYGINDYEIKKHKIGWSNQQQLLIYPIYDPHNNLIMWQGRNFGSGVKYLTKGPKSDILYLCGQKPNNVIIVTEDLISAIKVGRKYQSAPLWGSDMPIQLIKRVADEFSILGVWLDQDKTQKAVEIALRASQYIPTFVINSLKDPKYYSEDIIVQYVDMGSREQLTNEGVSPETSEPEEGCETRPCYNHSCGVCKDEQAMVEDRQAREEAKNKITKHSTNVEINAVFSGLVQCPECKRKTTEVKDCLRGACPFNTDVNADIKYDDPNVEKDENLLNPERPWDYKKEASGS